MTTKANRAGGDGAAAKVGDVDNADTNSQTKAVAQAKSWRDILTVHPAADLFPMMSEAELKVLGEDIKQNGLTNPIVVFVEFGPDRTVSYSLLDGRNRLAALELVGVNPIRVNKPPRGSRFRYDCGLVGDLGTNISSFDGVGIRYECVDDPWAFVLSANLWRRHLNSEQRRDLISKVLKATPERSNNAIAKQVRADDKTVASVRRDLEARSEIPNVPVRTDTKGRAQPATKPKPEKVASSATGADIEKPFNPVAVIEMLITGDDPGPQTKEPKSPSRRAAKPEPVKSGSAKALAEFKVAVDIWFAQMDAAEQNEAAKYVAEKNGQSAALRNVYSFDVPGLSACDLGGARG